MTKFNMDKDVYLSIYKKALFIKYFEEKLIELEESKKIEHVDEHYKYIP